jgi:hypothetical protein
MLQPLMTSFPDLFETLTRKNLKGMQDFKKDFNIDDPVLKVDEDTPEYIQKDVKSISFMWKMIKLFDDMPEGLTEIGMKVLLPDLMTIEMKAKTDGYPKFI